MRVGESALANGVDGRPVRVVAPASLTHPTPGRGRRTLSMCRPRARARSPSAVSSCGREVLACSLIVAALIECSSVASASHLDGDTRLLCSHGTRWSGVVRGESTLPFQHRTHALSFLQSSQVNLPALLSHAMGSISHVDKPGPRNEWEVSTIDCMCMAVHSYKYWWALQARTRVPPVSLWSAATEGAHVPTVSHNSAWSYGETTVSSDRESPAQGGGTLPEPGGGALPSLPLGSFVGSVEEANDVAGVVSRSEWFALASGLASIGSLMLALFTTQVRFIPFSLYRALVWRRVLLLSIGGGLAAAGLIALGQGLGTSWRVGGLIGAVMSVYGLLYDPLKKIRNILLRERRAIHAAMQEQLKTILGDANYDELGKPARDAYEEHRMYFSELQVRMIESLLGTSPSIPYQVRGVPRHRI